MKNIKPVLLLTSLLLSQSVALSAPAGLCSHIWSQGKNVGELLETYRETRPEQKIIRTEKLIFEGVGGRDVYNPTKPFAINFHGRSVEVMAGRVEARDSEHSEVMFFAEQNGIWSPLSGAPKFKMQDPFFTFINGEIIFGGVQIFEREGGGLDYKTVFFRGRSLEDLNPAQFFAAGPMKMKDIRLAQLKDGRIALFTRPQGVIPGTTIDAGPGRIGLTVIDSLSQLTPEVILRAPLLEGQFSGLEWGGVNEAQLLPDGTLGVLAHAARFNSEKNRDYFPVVFTVAINNKNIQVSEFEMLMERGDLSGGLAGQSKRDDLRNVVFAGGLKLDVAGNMVTASVGAGDAETHAHTRTMPRVFARHLR